MIEKTITQLEKILKSPGCNKVPLRIKTEDDAITAATNFDTHKLVFNFNLSIFIMVYNFNLSIFKDLY